VAADRTKTAIVQLKLAENGHSICSPPARDRHFALARLLLYQEGV
jgi:hypothetical protein